MNMQGCLEDGKQVDRPVMKWRYRCGITKASLKSRGENFQFPSKEAIQLPKAYIVQLHAQ